MPNTYLQAACLGVIAGMRSMGAPALVSDRLARTPSGAPEGSPLRWLGTAKTAQVFKILAAGEIVGDKLPRTPARTAPGPLSARLLSGALSGAALCAAGGKPPSAGAAVGALGALAGTFAFYHLRRRLGQATGLPDPIVAVAEDALAYGGGWLVLQPESSGRK